MDKFKIVEVQGNNLLEFLQQHNYKLVNLSGKKRFMDLDSPLSYDGVSIQNNFVLNMDKTLAYRVWSVAKVRRDLDCTVDEEGFVRVKDTSKIEEYMLFPQTPIRVMDLKSYFDNPRAIAVREVPSLAEKLKKGFDWRWESRERWESAWLS